MIIDTHTHLMVGPGQELATVERFVDGLRSFGAHRALLFTWEGLLGDYQRGNDQLAEAASGFPDILFPCCSANPRDGDRARSG